MSAHGIPLHVIEAWSALPDRPCPCRRQCGASVKVVCDQGYMEIGNWLPREIAKEPLDVDLLVQVLIYWSPAVDASQVEFNREADRLQAELTTTVGKAVTR